MKTYITNDMSIAAFLLMNGRTILKVEKKSPYIFEFEDNDNKCEKIALSFLTSECSKYDGYLRMLRGMLRSQP
mgnify:CR=1 FL=1|tara:strand:- start:222 stop:440 length:219 start_codon:yes stop_codon:yes gene_type:complete